MRWLAVWLMLLLSVWPAERGRAQAPLRTLAEVAALSASQADRKLPVEMSVAVTYARPVEGTMFVADGANAMYVNFPRDLGLVPGDQVEVSGHTEASFRNIVVANSVRVVGHGELAPPPSAAFGELIQGKFDSRLVEVSGHVLSAELDIPSNALRFQLKMPEGRVDGVIARAGKMRAEEILDADVKIRGIAAGTFNSRTQMAGVWLHVFSDASVTVVRPPSSNPWSIPIVPVDGAIYAYRNSNASRRVRLAGTLTYFEQGQLAVIEDAGKSILVETYSRLPLKAGDRVEATGLPAIRDENVRLEFGLLRKAAPPAAMTPQAVQWDSAALGKYAYNLVSMEGQVVGLVHDSRVDVFILLSGGHLFSASLRHSSSNAKDPVADAVAPSIGSRVRVTGICFVDSGNHWQDQLWFDLRMRSLNDVTVLQQPSWWTVKRLAYIVMIMSTLTMIAVCWVAMLGRRLRKRTAQDALLQRRLAEHEQQRSRILELISGCAPLDEVLSEIRAMVASRLDGAPCWFELASRDQVPPGCRPDAPTRCQELFSPERESLGYLIANPNAASTEHDVSTALIAGARLAELAIDTQRLYGDLRHRSEYDLLTDIPNRFSMERRLEELMLSTRSGDSVFGLIYVDLDRFKQVNDIHGHAVGDLYLIEVAKRMKAQLRNGDILARIGGDEFVALVAMGRNRADAEEIAERLERCFDEPFDLDGLILAGAASVGLAVFPEDGASKEELQRSADANMYANKQSKRHRATMAEAAASAEQYTVRA